MGNGFQYGNNPDGYTQQEIDREQIGYDEETVCDALCGCIIGAWSRRECSFGDGNGAVADLYGDMGIQADHHGFVITMPDGSQHRVDVRQVRGPRWNSRELSNQV